MEVGGGEGLQIFFSALRVSVWSKNRGGDRTLHTPPLDPPLKPMLQTDVKKRLGHRRYIVVLLPTYKILA